MPMTQRPFSYDLSPAGQTLTLHGEVDEAASIELRDLLKAITADLVGDLRINLTDVDFLPSVAIGVLAAGRSRRATGSRNRCRRTQPILACSTGPSVLSMTARHSTSANAPHSGQSVVSMSHLQVTLVVDQEPPAGVQIHDPVRVWARLPL